MKKVIVVCEGQTEEAFVKRVLYPELWPLGVFAEARLMSTSPVAKGGMPSGRQVLYFLRNILLNRQNVYVTTFFDLYSLPRDFPGREEDSAHVDPLERAEKIKTALHLAVTREAGCIPDRFFPHIQPCEFESLLFSDTTGFVRTEPRWRAFADKLADARRDARSPEHINDGTKTHPSARLRNLLRPRYRKVAHGVRVSARIGIDRIRTECRHFDHWLAHIENLAPLRPEA